MLFNKFLNTCGFTLGISSIYYIKLEYTKLDYSLKQQKNISITNLKKID